MLKPSIIVSLAILVAVSSWNILPANSQMIKPSPKECMRTKSKSAACQRSMAWYRKKMSELNATTNEAKNNMMCPPVLDDDPVKAEEARLCVLRNKEQRLRQQIRDN